MFTIACCLIVGLGLGSGLGLDLWSGWLVVMHTYLYYFRLSLLHSPTGFAVPARIVTLMKRGDTDVTGPAKIVTGNHGQLDRGSDDVRRCPAFRRRRPTTTAQSRGRRRSSGNSSGEVGRDMRETPLFHHRHVVACCSWRAVFLISCSISCFLSLLLFSPIRSFFESFLFFA